MNMESVWFASILVIFSFPNPAELNKYAPIQCPNNQKFQKCGSACDITCDNVLDPPVCQRICKAKCGCPSETPILHNERCITYEQCLTETIQPESEEHIVPTCPEGQVYQKCGSVCNYTCPDGISGPSCHRSCVARCGCPGEIPVWNNGKCTKYSECEAATKVATEKAPAKPKCPSNKEFRDCGSACNYTCLDGAFGPGCRRSCKPGCRCPSATPVWHNNKCIKYTECGKEPPILSEKDIVLEEKDKKNQNVIIQQIQRALGNILNIFTSMNKN